MTNNNCQSDGSRAPPIFELVERTKKFIRFELVHAGIAVAIFFGIFLVLQPWNYSSTSEGRPYWMVGPPLIYFLLDLLLALMLHFRMLNELRPRTCKVWMFLQVGNLILLTLLGFFMIWQIEFVDYSYLKLIAALLVLYVYKTYRISVMQKLLLDMVARCSITTFVGSTTTTSNNNNLNSTNNPTLNNNSRGGGNNITFASHHQLVREQIVRSTQNISVQQQQQPDSNLKENVKWDQQSSA